MQNKLVISNIKGGFGNQLHQFGTGLAQAIKLNAEFKVDLSFFEEDKYKKWYKLDKINVNIDIATPEEIEILKSKPDASILYRGLKKLGFHHQYAKKTDIVDIYGFEPDNRILNLKESAYLSGWCAKEIYVRPIRSILMEQFRPKEKLSQSAENYLQSITSTNSVSIHIRRGDYLELEHFFRIIPLDYYKDAVEEIYKRVQDPVFYIFSNDLNWVKDNLDFVHNPVFVDVSAVENYTGFADIEEFEIMKNCKHNVIGNSSFSWWAAYLNNNESKIVITPKKWFNDSFYQKSLEKYPIFPDSWLTL